MILLALVEMIPQMVWVLAGDGTPVYFNQKWLDYTALKPDGREAWEEVVHPDDLVHTQEVWSKSAASGTVVEAVMKSAKLD